MTGKDLNPYEQISSLGKFKGQSRSEFSVQNRGPLLASSKALPQRKPGQEDSWLLCPSSMGPAGKFPAPSPVGWPQDHIENLLGHPCLTDPEESLFPCYALTNELEWTPSVAQAGTVTSQLFQDHLFLN